MDGFVLCLWKPPEVLEAQSTLALTAGPGPCTEVLSFSSKLGQEGRQEWKPGECFFILHWLNKERKGKWKIKGREKFLKPNSTKRVLYFCLNEDFLLQTPYIRNYLKLHDMSGTKHWAEKCQTSYEKLWVSSHPVNELSVDMRHTRCEVPARRLV